MRNVFNILAGIAGGAVCALMFRLLEGSDRDTVLFNEAFLAAMLFVIVFGICTCFVRLLTFRMGLKCGIRNLSKMTGHESLNAASMGPRERSLFNHGYLNRAYSEYMNCRTASGWDCDICDYINEDAVDSYSHASIAEIIPDVLTSLGILGTFIGLIWGLKDFDPSSYEAMALSMGPLISGIKVAFVTSVMGISLSLVFSFWLRNEQEAAYGLLKAFLDRYGACEGLSEMSRRMNGIAENQNLQIESSSALPEAVSASVIQALSPAVSSLEKSVDRFIDTVTLNQQEIMASVSANVSKALAVQFGNELAGLRDVMAQTAEAQTRHLEYLKGEQSFYEDAAREFQARSEKQAGENDAMRREAVRAFKGQQEVLADMTRSVERLIEKLDRSVAAQETACESMTQCAQTMTEVRDEVSGRMDAFSSDIRKTVDESVTNAVSEMTGTGLLISEIRKLNAHLEKLEESHPGRRGLSR